MRVLITGGAGFLGGVLARRFLADGHDVRVTLRRSTAAVEGLDVERVQADTTDPATLPPAVDGVDLLVHAAAMISITGDPEGRVMRTNVEGTRHVMRAALDAGVSRVVHVSSLHALDDHPQDQLLDESRPNACDADRRVAAYDRSKGLGEAEVHAAVADGLDAVIVNPSAIIGPLDFGPSRLGRALIDLYHRRLPALVPGGYDWVDVRDIVDGVLAAAERGTRGERYLLTGHHASFLELASCAAAITGVPRPRLVVPTWLAHVGVPFVGLWASIRGTEPLFTRESLTILQSNSRATRARAERELGYRPRALDETLRDTYTWFSEQGLLHPPLPSCEALP